MKAQGSITVGLVPGETKTGQVQIRNMTDVALIGLAVEVADLPDVLSAEFTLPDELPGSGAIMLTYSITAAADAGPLSGSTSVMITTAEGVSINIPLAATVTPLRAQLVTDPGYLRSGMLRGSQTAVSFKVVTTNVDAGPIPDHFSFALTEPGIPSTFFDILVQVDIDSTNPIVQVSSVTGNGVTLIPVVHSAQSVPEPMTLSLLVWGLAGIVPMRYLLKQAKEHRPLARQARWGGRVKEQHRTLVFPSSVVCNVYHLRESRMTHMVRKQIYIEKRHERVLKQLSEAVGVSEAEIVRRAIEREAVDEKRRIEESDRSACEKIISFVKGRQGSSKKHAYKWRRQDAYEPQEGRIIKSKSIATSLE
jgi:hypothetical protein